MREELLAALQARLDRAGLDDLSPVLEAGALDEARGLAGLLRDGDGDLQARRVLGWLHWYRHLALPQTDDDADWAAAITLLTPCFIAGDRALPSGLEPALAERVAAALLERAADSPDPNLNDDTAGLWQRIVEATPDDHGDRAIYLSNLGGALQARYERTRSPADLDEAIRADQAAVDAASQGDPNRVTYLSELATALQASFELTGSQADLDQAIRVGRAAVEAAPGDGRGRAVCLSNLGSCLRARSELTGSLTDLDEAIRMGREAAQAMPSTHSDRAVCLATLGLALRCRYWRAGNPADLHEAIGAIQAVVAVIPDGHPGRTGWLSNLAGALLDRFELTGSPADLDNAAQASRTALTTMPSGHPGRAGMMSELANALRKRFERSSELTDLDQAIQLMRDAADATPEGHPDRAGQLSNLGAVLQSRFVRTGEMRDLDEAIEAARAAIDAIPNGHPFRAGVLSNLAAALRSRYSRTGALCDLDVAIRTARAAVQAAPLGDPMGARYLSTLSNALLDRFERTGASSDLDAAIRAGQDAVKATPAGQIYLALYLSNVGDALQARFKRTGSPTDLGEAIRIGRAAVEATPEGDPMRPGRLSNLGNALLARFRLTGQPNNLDAAIEALHDAVRAAPADEVGRPARLSGLGIALLARFQHGGSPSDLDAAIATGQGAVNAAPEGYAGQAILLANLGSSLRARFGITRSPADRDAASDSFSAAALAVGQPSVRIQAAREAARLMADSDPAQSAELLEGAVRLLGEVAPRQLARSDQQHALGGFAGLASEAAALALAAPGPPGPGRAARALGLLEAGRAVLISQALATRDDLTDLRRQHPALAERFTSLRDGLDRPEAALPPTLAGPVAERDVPGHAAQERQQLAEQLADILAQIRALDGFGSFGLPPTTEELLAQARPGPVVTFNVSARRCDALILTTSGISSVALSRLSQSTLIEQVDAFHQALHTALEPAARRSDRTEAQRTLTRVLEWLWDAAAEPILDALGYTGTPQPGRPWPRVWWAPGGLLGMLPIHAAGHHAEPAAEGRARRTVMDRVISSYTPTIRALRYARQLARQPDPAGRTLIVAMPVTPGLPGGAPLPNVSAEVAQVSALTPDPVILADHDIRGAETAGEITGPPTRASVFTNLPLCSIAHFACHGYSHPGDPSHSLLLLRDHDTAPLTVASLAPVHHERLQLVYLSACRTAFTSAAELLDEVIHLTSAFQLAGSWHVIGTLWEIGDATSADVAAAFYRELRAGLAALDTDRAAIALHTAVRAARDAHHEAPSQWAAYLHAGP